MQRFYPASCAVCIVLSCCQKNNSFTNLLGSKHWTPSSSAKLWNWIISRLDSIVGQIKPETLSFWEQIFQVNQFEDTSLHFTKLDSQYQLQKRDPRRNKALVDWILSLPLEFNGDSAFESMFFGNNPIYTDLLKNFLL